MKVADCEACKREILAGEVATVVESPHKGLLCLHCASEWRKIGTTVCKALFSNLEGNDESLPCLIEGLVVLYGLGGTYAFVNEDERLAVLGVRKPDKGAVQCLKSLNWNLNEGNNTWWWDDV